MGGAVIAGGQGIAMRNFFQYSRTQEGAADAAAMRYLDATGQSARGLLEFFNILSGEELLAPERQDPYLRTHPLTRDRIEALAEFVARSPYSDAPVKPAFQDMHARMVAKLHGFLDHPADDRPPLPAAGYEPAGALRPGDRRATAPATPRPRWPAIDALIAEEPNNPYFRELKGQVLFEAGRAAEALGPYEKAVQLRSDAPLLRVDLARVQLAPERSGAARPGDQEPARRAWPTSRGRRSSGASWPSRSAGAAIWPTARWPWPRKRCC